MHVLTQFSALTDLPGPVSLAIGVFDGLHLGHQEVIQAAKQHAAQHRGTAVVMSFQPHPLQVLRPGSEPRLLCGQTYQQVLLERLGVQAVFHCPFDATTAALSGEAFLDQLVSACRPLGCISVGYTWVFGKDRSGTIQTLLSHGRQQDYAVFGVPPLQQQGQVVSSTWIRELVAQGNFTQVQQLLGRPYALYGSVVPGRGLARKLDFPTANLQLEATQLPPLGVYAVEVEIQGQMRPGIANLGLRPTVETTAAVSPQLEVHLLDWQGDLYGMSLEVIFKQFVRPEQKFSDLTALQAQIQKDITFVRSTLPFERAV